MMFLYIFILFNIVEGIWPPAYKLNLTDEEIFNISEWSNNDEISSDEDEMIKKDDVSQMKLNDDDGRYKRLDQYVARFRKDTDDDKSNWYVSNVTNLDNEEPWELFLINNSRKKRYKVDFNFNDNTTKRINEETKEMVRDAGHEIDNYNYDDLRKEYESELKEIEKLNITFNSTNTQNKESVKNVMKEIVDFKSPPKNCTKEEAQGIGKPDMKNATKPSEKKRIALITLKIFLVWMGVYFVLAIVFWCYKGWCCCCCCCKLCKPRNEIDEAKKFMLDNPPGIYGVNDEKIIYPYNQYEAYTYNELREQLLSL